MHSVSGQSHGKPGSWQASSGKVTPQPLHPLQQNVPEPLGTTCQDSAGLWEPSGEQRGAQWCQQPFQAHHLQQAQRPEEEHSPWLLCGRAWAALHLPEQQRWGLTHLPLQLQVGMLGSLQATARPCAPL